jgi:protein gp37
MNETSISWTEWTDGEGNVRKGYTWNPVSGCSKVSPGCQNCYAEAWSHRWNRSFEVTLHPDKLDEVKKIPSGAKVFVNSMSDLFHKNVPFTYIWGVMKAIESRPDVIFQILTKRPERVREYFYHMSAHPKFGNGGDHEKYLIPSNVWLGVSVEMRKFYASRVGLLLRLGMLENIHSGKFFISFEPLLGDIGKKIKFDNGFDKIDWIIIGGESGPHHRPMKIEWARNLVKQAQEQGVAVWMKQLGGFRPGGNIEDFPEDLRLREFPKGGV